MFSKRTISYCLIDFVYKVFKMIISQLEMPRGGAAW